MKLQGWRAAGAAFLAGALAALAMPPLYWLPLAVVGLVVFVWLWETAPGPRSALLRGWAWLVGTGSAAAVQAAMANDYTPLQFIDPVTGEEREFESRITLQW